MTDKFVQEGNVIDVTAGGDITQGTIAVLESCAGVYTKSGVSGDVIPVALTGVFSLTKIAGASEGLAVGRKVYTTATGRVTTVATGTRKPLGFAAAAAATGATTCRVRLHAF